MGRTGLSTHQLTQLVNFRGQPQHLTSMNLCLLDFKINICCCFRLTWQLLDLLTDSLFISPEKVCYISYITCLLSLLTSHHALYCVWFITEGPYRVPSFPDLRSWRQVTRSEQKGPWHSLTTSQWTSMGMLLIDILKGGPVRISSCKSEGDRSLLQQILTLHEWDYCLMLEESWY